MMMMMVMMMDGDGGCNCHDDNDDDDVGDEDLDYDVAYESLAFFMIMVMIMLCKTSYAKRCVAPVVVYGVYIVCVFTAYLKIQPRKLVHGTVGPKTGVLFPISGKGGVWIGIVV